MVILAAWWSGLVRVLRAPLVVTGIYVMTVVIAVPLGGLLHSQLPDHAAPLAPITETPEPPDADWLDEVSSRAGIFSDSLTPAIFGVAAPITNLASVLDARAWSLPAIIASAAYFVCWSWLWGGLIVRLSARKATGLVAFVGDASRLMLRMFGVGVIGIGLFAVAFLVLHPLLFGPLYRLLTAGALERTTFIWRSVLAGLFGVAVALVAQAMDFARITIAIERTGVRRALTRGWQFVREQPLRLLGLSLLNGILFVALTAAYGATEFVPGGSVPRLSRVILVGQAYLVARLVIRLTGIGAQVSLWQRASKS